MEREMFNISKRIFVTFLAIMMMVGSSSPFYGESTIQRIKSKIEVRERTSDFFNYDHHFSWNIQQLFDRKPQPASSFTNAGIKSNEGCRRCATQDFETENRSPYLNLSQYPGEGCNRVCETGDNRLCYFEFYLEFYQAMGIACGRCDQGVAEDCNHPQCIVGDGWDKGVMSINRQIPGPAVQVCKDDIVIVDVHNRAHGTAGSLHWHGVHMVDTPHMDGVPFLTQCPITYSNTFRYNFRATEPGTQFYHSHAGHHKANGHYGAFIIRQPKDDEPLSALYDHDLPEHYILISDWMHTIAEQQFPGLDRPEGIFADSIVINGRGVHTNPVTQERTTVPPTIYYVTPGQRYRFRLINSINHACPVQLQIEQHNFSIIASDSFGALPKTIDTLMSNAGERYDFILNANHTMGDFWLRARGFGTCADRPTESYALIRYNTSGNANSEIDLNVKPYPNYNESYPSTTILNHPNATCWSASGSSCITQLSAYDEDEDLRTAKANHTFFLGFDNHLVPSEEVFNNTEYNHFANIASNLTAVGAINNLSMIFPDYPPLTQPELIDESQFCDNNNMLTRCAGRTLCHCVHRLKVELNSIVELIIVDATENVNPINHPFHLHGYRFMVVGMGQNPFGGHMDVAKAKQIENNTALPRDLLSIDPPFKDTVSIPSRGYVIIRLRATNPGFWLMHCHYEWHLAIGMGLVLQVGETSQMVKPPKDFPKCGNYAPRLRESDIKLSPRKLEL